MKPHHLLFAVCLSLSACDKPTQQSNDDQSASATTNKRVSIDSSFEWSPERFADIQIIRYQISGFDELKPKQKELVYPGAVSWVICSARGARSP